MEHLINTYAQRARDEREREERLIEEWMPSHSYVLGGENQKTNNANNRFFKLSKLKQVLLVVSGQRKKLINFGIKQQ